jgi:hypothetical protein
MNNDLCNLIFATAALVLCVLLGDWFAGFIPQPFEAVLAARTTISSEVVVLHSRKGDRLVPASFVSRERIPFGCEAASSPLAEDGAFLPIARCIS